MVWYKTGFVLLGFISLGFGMLLLTLYSTDCLRVGFVWDYFGVYVVAGLICASVWFIVVVIIFLFAIIVFIYVVVCFGDIMWFVGTCKLIEFWVVWYCYFRCGFLFAGWTAYCLTSDVWFTRLLVDLC